MIWLLACIPAERGDQARYLDSTTAGRDEAPGICARIQDATLRADCLIHAAARHARAGDIAAAQTTCQTIEAGLWRDECWFLTADDAGLIGEDAVAACRRAGRFEPHCRGHALGRAAQEVDLTVGQEARSARALGALVAAYRPRSGGQSRRTMANELLAVRVGDRWAAEPFDPALCGSLAPPLCAWAYRASLDGADTALAALCPGPVTSTAVRDIGLSGWTEAGQTIAGAVWAGICQQVAGGLPVDLRPARLPEELLPVE